MFERVRSQSRLTLIEYALGPVPCGGCCVALVPLVKRQQVYRVSAIHVSNAVVRIQCNVEQTMLLHLLCDLELQRGGTQHNI